MLTVALCIICHERPDELQQALASASDEGWDETIVLDMASDPPLEAVPGALWLRSADNLGVTAGRNRIAAAATADILVFLDDDAVFLSPVVSRVRGVFADQTVAAVAFRVVRSGGEMVSAEFPFRGAVHDPGSSRECSYFLGGAHAVRREEYLEAGGYDERFFYSTEEVDLAFRLMAKGHRLWYAADIVVEHRPSRSGRSIQPNVPALRLRNRIVLARRHLPAVLAMLHVLAWGVRTFREAIAARSVRLWVRAWRDGMRAEATRRPLPLTLLLHVHRVGGRVLW